MIVFILISLPNYSDTVRWSVDLRWQRPSDPIGFYDLKDGVLLRSSKDPNMKINWEPFDSVNRHDVQIKAVIDEVDEQFYLFTLLRLGLAYVLLVETNPFLKLVMVPDCALSVLSTVCLVFATVVKSQHRTLTHSDTWFHPYRRLACALIVETILRKLAVNFPTSNIPRCFLEFALDMSTSCIYIIS